MPHSESLTTPRACARALLAAALAGNAYLGYFQYKAEGFGAPNALDDRLLGLAAAPDQYRMGVYLLAHALAIRLHLAPALALTLLGGLAGFFAALLLFAVLERSTVYAQAGSTAQWLGAMAFVLLILWTLPWTLFPEKPETLPAAACVAALVWLWQLRTAPLPTWLSAAAVLVVSCVLATFRADVACVFHLGLLACVLIAGELSLSLRRPIAVVTASLAALAAAGMQFWLARIVYPQASYGPVKLWQLRPNLVHATRWPPFAIFLLPLLWMLAIGLRRGFVRDPIGRAVLAAALLYVTLWATLGKIDEVRIFLPFAWALAPLTAQTLMQRAESEA